MYIKSSFFAILMAILPLFVSATPQYQQKLATVVSATPQYQQKLATVVLSDLNASYMVKIINEKVYVVTFAYKNAAETCKLLQSKGVDVVSVKNYNKNEQTREVC